MANRLKGRGAVAPEQYSVDDDTALLPVVAATAGSGAAARGRRRRALLSLVVLAAVAGGSWWAGTKTTSVSAENRKTAAPPPALLTAPVIDKTLTTQVPASGNIGYGSEESVNVGQFSVPGAVSIVTAAGPAMGTSIEEGSVVAQVAGRPVIALVGTTPMYRTLEPGAQGPDVVQLQQDLEALGYGVYDASGTYGASTQTALAALYQADGFTPPPSNPQPSSTPVTPASAGTSANGSSSIASKTSASTGSSSAGSTSSVPAGMPVPQAEVVFLPTLPATVVSDSEAVGQAITNPAMALAWGAPQATLTVTSAEASAVAVGDAVSVTPTGGSPLAGKVTAVAPASSTHSSGSKAGGSSLSSPVGSSSTSTGTSHGSTVQVSLAGTIPPTVIGATATAQVTVQSSNGAVLAIPVGGLRANGNGAAYVQIHTRTGSRRVDVSVGQAIGGYVEVTPRGGTLHPGEKVVLDQPS